MRTTTMAMAWMVGIGLAAAAAGAAEDKAFGDAHFMAYEGSVKSWPTGDAAQVIKDYAVPIYIGLPGKKYKVLGRIYDPRKTGIGVIGRGLAEGLFSEKDRQRDCASQAKYRQGDGVLVTKDKKIIEAFGLEAAEIEKTAPLFAHKDKLVLAIKFL
jgi:hypothetical protein